MITRNRLVDLYHNLFNVKFAVFSAIFNGGVVLFINGSYGVLAASTAGLTQAASSFLSTGVTARIVQHFSPLKNVWLAYGLGSLVPAGLTLSMSYVAHRLHGTLEPFTNSLPATIISFVTSFITNLATRRGYWRPPNYPV